MKRALIALTALAALHVGAVALAQDPHPKAAPRIAPQTARPVVTAHGASEVKPAGPHAPAAEGGAHDDGHHGPGHINWFYGLVAAREGVTEPSLLWRPKDMPAPYAAAVINFVLFGYIIMRIGKRPLLDGLKKRRDDLMREVDEAARIRDEAEERLAEYEDKLEHLEGEVARVKEEYEEQAHRDEERLLAEAKERREKMKRDAELTVLAEGRELEAELLVETIARASAQATSLVSERLTAADHDRLAEELLVDLRSQSVFGGAR